MGRNTNDSSISRAEDFGKAFGMGRRFPIAARPKRRAADCLVILRNERRLRADSSPGRNDNRWIWRFVDIGRNGSDRLFEVGNDTKTPEGFFIRTCSRIHFLRRHTHCPATAKRGFCCPPPKKKTPPPPPPPPPQPPRGTTAPPPRYRRVHGHGSCAIRLATTRDTWRSSSSESRMGWADADVTWAQRTRRPISIAFLIAPLRDSRHQWEMCNSVW